MLYTVVDEILWIVEVNRCRPVDIDRDTTTGFGLDSCLDARDVLPEVVVWPVVLEHVDEFALFHELDLLVFSNGALLTSISDNGHVLVVNRLVSDSALVDVVFLGVEHVDLAWAVGRLVLSEHIACCGSHFVELVDGRDWLMLKLLLESQSLKSSYLGLFVLLNDLRELLSDGVVETHLVVLSYKLTLLGFGPKLQLPVFSEEDSVCH